MRTAVTSPPAPNMADRLYLQLHAMGLPGQVFWVWEVEHPLEVEPLRAAFAATIREDPVLSSIIERTRGGFRRRRVAFDAAVLHVRFHQHDWSEGALPAPERPDLERGPPVSLVLAGPIDGRTRICLAMHHSAGDGFSALYVLERLGQHYAAELGGGAAEAAPVETAARTYRSLFWGLPWTDKRVVLARGVRSLLGAVRTSGYDTGTAACATFVDHPPSSIGAPGLRYARHPIPWTLMRRLKAVTRRREISRTDAVLAATVVVASKLWPQAEPLPVLVSVPIGTRQGPARDVSNRVLPNNIRIPASQLADVSSALGPITAQGVRVRGRASGLVQATERAILSLLPTPLATRMIENTLSHPVNTRETLTFSSLGSDPQPHRFAGHAVVDSYCMASLLAPPGLKLSTIPSKAAYNLVVHWLDGVTEEARAQALGPAIEAELARWVESEHDASPRPPRGEAPG